MKAGNDYINTEIEIKTKKKVKLRVGESTRNISYTILLVEYSMKKMYINEKCIAERKYHAKKDPFTLP